MDLEEDSVDAVVCGWGYMLMADPAAALRETRRVLRASGRLAFAAWATPE
jgi:ubiquinone/menaquinone biosynthesis C-methylase UbiE